MVWCIDHTICYRVALSCVLEWDVFRRGDIGIKTSKKQTISINGISKIKVWFFTDTEKTFFDIFMNLSMKLYQLSYSLKSLINHQAEH